MGLSSDVLHVVRGPEPERWLFAVVPPVVAVSGTVESPGAKLGLRLVP